MIESGSNRPVRQMQPIRQVIAMALVGLTICACLRSLSASLTSGLLEDVTEDASYQEPSGSGGSWSHWWSYDGISGPDYWNINKHWRLCASGRKQSPVNIRTERLVYDHLLGPIKLRWRQSNSRNRPIDNKLGLDRANQTIPIKLINSGRGIETWLELGPSLIDSSRSSGAPDRRGGQQQQRQHQDSDAEWLLSSGPLSYEYKLFKLELHSTTSITTSASGGGAERPNSEDIDEELEESSTATSPENNSNSSPRGSPLAKEPEALRASARSSEHLIDGRPFEAELQMHFYNGHLAASAREALQMADERPPASLFAVIGVLIKLVAAADDRHHNQLANSSGPLDFVLDNLGQLQNQGDSVNLNISPKQLETLVTDRRQYVAYEGSMNRPPCAESVDWIILNRPLRVSESKFAQIYDKLTNTNQENVRPVRQLNNRLLRTTISSLRQRRSADKCQKANCNLGSQTEANRTRSSAHTGGQHSNRHTISGPHWNRALDNREQHCSMKPNYVYQLSYGL